MSRSKWKFYFIEHNLFKKLANKNDIHKTWSRRSTIYPAAVGLKLNIHDGQNMVSREILEPMIGHKLGEFVRTRKQYKPKKKKKKKKR